jgi:protein-L-isoaspartate(D-aspartate) O-methyltransferase
VDKRDDFGDRREKMVTDQLIKMNIHDQRVLDAMLEVPREDFVPKYEKGKAYVDGPLKIGCGQTISQPYMVALMSELLDLAEDERVLEVGTGSGYQTCILSKLAGTVYTIERHKKLAQGARELFRKLALTNIEVMVGDGTAGWPQHAPYDGIIVTAAAPEAPVPLLEQLAPGGRLVIPVGSRSNQMLQLIKRKEDRYVTTSHCGCRFVPLVGEYGWEE